MTICRFGREPRQQPNLAQTPQFDHPAQITNQRAFDENVLFLPQRAAIRIDRHANPAVGEDSVRHP